MSEELTVGEQLAKLVQWSQEGKLPPALVERVEALVERVEQVEALREEGAGRVARLAQRVRTKVLDRLASRLRKAHGLEEEAYGDSQGQVQVYRLGGEFVMAVKLELNGVSVSQQFFDTEEEVMELIARGGYVREK